MSPSQIQTTRMSVADDILYGLDIEDDDSREFLKSLIVSGRVPRDELKQLYGASFQRGVDEWYMLIECATSIKNQVASRAGLRDDPGVVPYVAYILSERAASDQAQRLVEPELEPEPRRERPKSSKRRLSKAVSHFWEDTKDVPAESKPSLAACDVRSARDELVQVLQPCSKASKRKQSRTPSRTRKRSPESNSDVTTSREAADSALIPSLDPGSLSGIGVENEDDLAEHEKLTSWDLPAELRKPKRPAKSPYFSPAPSPKKPRPARGTVSSLPIPPLSAPRFGLIQEELADDPFRLLVAVTFLIRTTGRAAIPAFRQLVDRFPTARALADAEPADIIPMIRHLGLSAVRCAAVQRYARLWTERPPSGGVRYGVKHYPRPGDGRDVRAGGEYGAEEAAGEGDSPADVGRREAPGSAWEIGHLTQGPYAIDSWRIFCRDVLLGRADDWTGRGREATFQPEWMRVLPADKELRACLRWMWMREGWEWDPVSGERVVLREEMRRAVDERRVGYDDQGGLIILPQPLAELDSDAAEGVGNVIAG